MLKLGSARNVDDIPIPRLRVTMPVAGFPRFKVLGDFAEDVLGNRASRAGYRLARQWGLVRHTINLSSLFEETPDRPWEIVRYSPGLRFGRPIHQPDYLLGASVVMTAQRAAAIVGVENFDGQWLLTARDLANPADAPRDIAWFGAAHKRLSEEIPDYHYGSYLNFNSFAKVAP